MNKNPISFVILFFLALCTQSFAAQLTLDQYISEVESKNKDYIGAVEKSAGALERVDQGTLIFAPTAFGQFQRTDDRSLLLSLVNLGTRNLLQELSTGISMQTRFGLLGKVSYNIQQTKLFGASPTVVPNTNFYDTFIAFEFSETLWQDFFGKQSRLLEEATKTSILATHNEQKFNSIVTIVNAEKSYWRLVAALELVKIQRDSLDRGVKLKTWQEKRVKQRLSEDSDLIQASATLKMRELEFKSANIELELAMREFNQYRGSSENFVNETLIPPSVDDIINKPLPVFKGNKYDVEAARLATAASKANIDIARDKQLPALSFFGSAALKARNEDLQIATGDVIGTNYPIVKLGVKISIPLDFSTTSAVKSGYWKESIGTEQTLERKLEEQEFQRDNLIKKLFESKERLKILADLVEAQKAKFDKERERHENGRSTTYQVFLFEQDYLSAQINKINAIYQYMSLMAEAKTFQGAQS